MQVRVCEVFTGMAAVSARAVLGLAEQTGGVGEDAQIGQGLGGGDQHHRQEAECGWGRGVVAAVG
jgi:hypothetical protein